MKYLIGDIVKHLFFENSTFIVTDVLDYSEEGDESEVFCEVMEIYPVAKMSKKRTFETKNLKLHGRSGTKKYEMAMDLIRIERAKFGFQGKPEWEKVIEKNSKKKIIRVPRDVVEYDKLETIDDCLDSLSGLISLHEMFGDEAYLQLKEVVEKRLKELI